MMDELGQRSERKKQVRRQCGVEQLDFFASSYPSFNVAGGSRVPTRAGFFMTGFLLAIMSLYGAVKLLAFVRRDNADVFRIEKADHFDFEDVQRLDGQESRFAVGFRDYFTGRSLVDPRFTKLRAMVAKQQKDDGTYSATDLDMHPCTAEDFT